MGKKIAQIEDTFTLNEFDGGIDLRSGQYEENQNRFRELTNFYVTVGKKLRRRPPCIKVAGLFDAASQGFVVLRGAIYCFAKKGTAIAHTIASPVINTLFFDAPDYTTTWTLLQALTFNNVVVALIRHTFPGTVVTSRVFLHVFDSKANKPTYVEDPYCPTNWNPQLPLHIYRQGTKGAFDATFVPVMAVGGSKLWISRPDGNVSCSGINRPRVWNSRDYASLLTYGEWWYFIAPAGAAGVYSFIVSEPQANLVLDRTWSAYVLEYLDATGTWQQVTETSAVPALNFQYFAASAVSRFGGANEIQLQVYLTAPADQILRFRMIAGDPPTKVISGGTFDGSSAQFGVADINDSESFNGDGATVAFTMARFRAFSLVGFSVYVNGVLKTGGGVDYTASDAGPGVSPNNPAKITFVAAPAAGNKNIVVLPAAGPSFGTTVVEFEGVRTTYKAGSHAISNVAASSQNLVAITNAGAEANSPFPTGGPFSTTWNGQRRYNSRLLQIVAIGSNPPVGIKTAYTYGSDVLNQGQFYSDKLLDYQLNQAGSGEATYFATSNFDGGGGPITAMAELDGFLIFFYLASSQLWKVGPLPTPPDTKYESRRDVGTGATNSRPVPVQFFGSVVAPTLTGFRGFSAVPGLTFNSLQDTNIGEPIMALALPDITAATYWPFLGMYVGAGVKNGALTLYVLAYSKESKVSAWSMFLPTGITAVDVIVPIESKLYLKVGTSLYYLDAGRAVTSFRDSNDPAGTGNAFVSRAVWNFNTLKKPNTYKQFTGLDSAQQGQYTIDFQYVPNDESQLAGAILVPETTFGDELVPLCFSTHAVAPVLTTTDELAYQGTGPDGLENTGFVLEGIGLTFFYQRR